MNKVSFDKWKYHHFSHLIILYKKFVNRFEDILSHNIDWNSKNTFKVFCQSIYNASSKKLTPYLEPLTNLETTLYYKYSNE